MDGLLSEKIALKQGLLQGCNLAPTPSNVRDDMNALGFTIGQFRLKKEEFDDRLNKAINSYKEVVNESKERSRKVRDAEDPDRKKREREVR